MRIILLAFSLSAAPSLSSGHEVICKLGLGGAVTPGEILLADDGGAAVAKAYPGIVLGVTDLTYSLIITREIPPPKPGRGAARGGAVPEAPGFSQMLVADPTNSAKAASAWRDEEWRRRPHLRPFIVSFRNLGPLFSGRPPAFFPVFESPLSLLPGELQQILLAAVSSDAPAELSPWLLGRFQSAAERNPFRLRSGLEKGLASGGPVRIFPVSPEARSVVTALLAHYFPEGPPIDGRRYVEALSNHVEFCLAEPPAAQ